MTRLSDFRLLEVVFATSWIGAVSILWPAIKPSSQFGFIVGWGIRFGWPYSIAYVLFVYLVSFVVIVWAGLAVYLAVFGNPKARYLVRGLWTAVLTVGIVQTIMINFAGRNLSWISQWLPYVAALVVCMEVARRTASVRTPKYC